tara:strand:+ start:2149 stop:2808 length:660 start_codon:yes stop_codon:yes gene_type:complete
MTFCLETKLIKPDFDNEIKNIVVLLHGYGGDGNDIAQVSLNWKRFLPNTLFVCPNAPEICPINPSGYQWFDLSQDEEGFILNESKKNEIVLKDFLKEIKKEFAISNSKICLSGFSQGCMMSINVGLSSDEKYSGILGFSGKIINKKDLSQRMTFKSETLLIHGENDDIVPCVNSLEAKDFLERNKVPVKLEIVKNCGHHIPIEASSLGLKFIKKIFDIN